MTTTKRLALAPLVLLLAGLTSCTASEPSPDESTATTAPTVSASQTFQAIATPDFTVDEEWRANAKHTDSGKVTYSNTAEGATVAFEDFFKSMAYEFSTSYSAQEQTASSEEEKSKLVDQQLPRTMRYLDRSALGSDKVNAIIHEWVISSRMFGTGGAQIEVSRDGVTIANDGTATLTDGHVFYQFPNSTKVTAAGSDHEHYKLTYRNGIWVIIDVNISGPIQ